MEDLMMGKYLRQKTYFMHSTYNQLTHNYIRIMSVYVRPCIKYPTHNILDTIFSCPDLHGILSLKVNSNYPMGHIFKTPSLK
ncbi:hypothetical protein BpHYR1_051786 [Brachionus plicatilis]|uniref:Uncharacterized protein n=1 Tax=Brachionus plicatilis TaxID=10195 RepID=A0A3M7PEF0_BRAPC|nr:hypothetical protein BpHYR1_051786 [Brachionus plicatilis]